MTDENHDIEMQLCTATRPGRLTPIAIRLGETQCLNSMAIVKNLRLLGDPAFLDAFAKLRKAIITSVMYVCLYVCLFFRPHGTTRVPMYEFSRNFLFECFLKICRENSSFVKIPQQQPVYYINVVFVCFPDVTTHCGCIFTAR